jgi:hypothetical protein
MVGGLEEQADAIMQKAKEENVGAAIDYVTVDMSVAAKLSGQVDAEVKEEIEKKAASQSENLAFVDIDITQTTKIDGSEQTKDITETADLLEIIIPFDTAGRRDFKVFRYHANHASGEDVQPLTTAVNSDGEYIEIANGQITVHAKFFSTYAIGYSEGGNDAPAYAVTCSTTENGNVTVNGKYFTVGSKVTVTVKPEDGYELDKLLVTAVNGKEIEATDLGNGTYSFQMPDRSVNVTATFRTKLSACPGDEVCPIDRFTDAVTTEWYHDGVHYCIENGLMNGLPGNLFDPNGTTTRAQIVTILWRLEGTPVANYAMSFTDVAADQWYTEAVRWAAAEGIVLGYSETQFAPNDTVTREQMAVMLYRYVQYRGGGFSGMWMFLLDYPDRADVSDWAYEAMCWMIMHNVVDGVPDGDSVKLDPAGSATRAQAATMLWRFCEEIVKP